MQELLIGKSRLQTDHAKRTEREGGDLCAKSGTRPRVAVGLLPPSREGETKGVSRRRGDAKAVRLLVHVHPRGGTGDLEEIGMSASGPLLPFTLPIPPSPTTHFCQESGFWMPISAALRAVPDTASAPG